MEKTDWISNLKLRTSFGLSGNNRTPLSYPFIDLLFPANYPFGAVTGTSAVGQVPSRDIIANPDLTWERTLQLNSGIDLSLFKNAITLSVDVYQSKTEKLLLSQSAMAFTGVPATWNNIGRLRNRGIEFELTTNNFRRKDFKWTTSANLSYNKNKLIE